MSTFERERRYIVIKLSDAHAALSVTDFEDLERIQNRLYESRSARGKEPLLSVVVESDWPEYEPTWQAIQLRMSGDTANDATLPANDDVERAIEVLKVLHGDSAAMCEKDGRPELAAVHREAITLLDYTRDLHRANIAVEERCEGGSLDCGAVEFYDSEGVPLCKRCWDDLQASSP